MVRKFLLTALWYHLVLQHLPAQPTRDKSLEPTIEIKLKNVSLEDGLSQGYVSAVLQDKTGYLWIATADGLNRYDGYNFVIFRNNNDSQSIASNNIKRLFEDNRGRIWISFSQGGLDVFDKVSGTFAHILPLESHNIAGTVEEFSIVGSFRNGVTVLKDRAFYSIEPDGGDTVQKVKSRHSSLHYRMQPLKAASASGDFKWGAPPEFSRTADGNAWMLDADQRLFHIKIDTGLHEYELAPYTVPVQLVPPGAKPTGLPFLAVDPLNGYVYFQEFNNVYRLSPKTGTIELFMKETKLRSFLVTAVDPAGNIWCVNEGKPYFIDVSQRRGWFVESAEEQIQKKNSATGGNCYADRSGNIWFCTLGYGLMKINLRNASFHFITRKGDVNFSARYINSTAGGDVYITPWEGRECFFDTHRMKFVPSALQFGDGRHILYDGKNIPIHPLKPGAGIPGDILRSGNYYVRVFGEIYLGVAAPGAGYVSLIHTSPLRKAITGGSYALAGDHNVWVLSDNRFLRCIHLQSGDYNDIALPADAGTGRETMALDQSGNVWVTTEKGVCMYNVSTGRWRRYIDRPEISSLNGTVLSFFFPPDDDRHVWLGFEGKGFCKLDRVTGQCSFYTTRDGLPNNVVYGILQDEAGNLWMSTNKGISCFNPKANTFRNYTFEDGLQSNEFNRYCFKQLPGGNMLFGGVNGINYFNPSEIFSKKSGADVWLTDMFINNQPVMAGNSNPLLPFSLPDQQTGLTLKHDENLVTFRFALSDLTAPQQNQFSYKLEGIDKDWTRFSTGHEAVYTYLPPARYVFHVKGINRDGVMAENEIRFPFTIRAPWWQTWWFRTLVVLAVTALIYSLYRYRLNQVLRLQAIRNRISADMHDEIGSTLSSISFYSQALLMQGPDEKQRTVLEKIKDNAQIVQEGLSDIIWSVKADMDNFENLLIRMQRIANELLEPKNILFHFDADEKLKQLKTGMTVRKNIYLIFKEALHNAAKYAHCKNIRVTIKTGKHNILMSITDDGNGFDVDTKRNGNGLGNMRQRAVSMNGELVIQSSAGEGTSVTLLVKTLH